MKLLEPNVLYLDEQPPIVIKIKKPKAPAKIKKPTKKKELKKTKTKVKKTSKTSSLKATKIQEKSIIKQEVCKIGNKEFIVDPNDPLYTPQVEIKIEENSDKLETEIKLDEDEDFVQTNKPTDVEDQDYEDDDYQDDFEADDLFECEKMQISDNDDDDDEDEPLIKLTRKKGRPRKHKPEEYEDTIKAPRLTKCGTTCKQNCNEKFSEEQRKRMCDNYWELSEEEKLIYLRKHVKPKRLRRIKVARTNSRGKNCCYYLKDYIKDDEDDDGYVNEEVTHSISDLIRVCRKYFEATLCISNQIVKKSLSGCAQEADKNLALLMESIKANKLKEKEQKKQLKQVLDPETGNLITIDPKNKTKKLKSVATEKKPKEKLKRVAKPSNVVEERFPAPIKCAVRCIHKCHTKFTEQERKQMCDTFWSMDFKHRKDYILANVEVKEIETQRTTEFRTSNRNAPSYHTRFFLRTGLQEEKKRVCKDFMMYTLRTHRKFISNAIEFADKTTGYYMGCDRRGQHAVANKIAGQRCQAITDHINSYPTWVPNKKSKTKHLHHSLSIKKMFEDYKEKCQRDNIKPVSTHYYYKYFHANFKLHFLSNPDPKKGGGFLKLNPNVSHYTGEEPGGYWLDPQGERLDIRLFNPAQSMQTFQSLAHNQQNQSTIISHVSQDSFSDVDNPCNSLQMNPLNYTTSTNQQLANIVNPRAIGATSLLRLDLNPNLYDNEAQSSSTFRMNY